jgi:hypothetical protein
LLGIEPSSANEKVSGSIKAGDGIGSNLVARAARKFRRSVTAAI